MMLCDWQDNVGLWEVDLLPSTFKTRLSADAGA